jgi:uncharacterized protein
MDPVRFPTEDGVWLEGEWRFPDGPPRGSAVICHAHPRHGGSKDHPILWAIRNELAGKRGLATLGFNFRGTMGSAGEHGGGHDEVADVRAAVSAIRDASTGPTFVVGWSFGASVALREAFDDERVAALALVGLPLRPNDLKLPPLPPSSELPRLNRPLLFLTGEHDEYCPTSDLQAYSNGVAEVVIVDGVDHYLSKKEREAASSIGDFVARSLRIGGAETAPGLE